MGGFAQQKTVTVVYGGIGGYPLALLEHNPSRYASLQKGLIERLTGIIQGQSGVVVEAHDRTFLALFGITGALTNPAQSAIYATFVMREAIQTFSREVGVELTGTFAVHEGPIVDTPVQMGDRADTLYLGESLNVVKAVYRQDSQYTVRVTEPILAEAGDIFHFVYYSDLPSVSKQAIPLYGLVGMKQKTLRLSPREPFVGREEELALFDKRLRDVRQARGGILALLGETGMGKTELLTRLALRSLAVGCQFALARCYGLYQQTPFWAFRDLIERFCEISEDTWGEIPEILAERLASYVDSSHIPALEYLLGGSPTLFKNASPESVQAALAAALLQFFTRITDESPLVLLFDDLHLMDEASRTFLVRIMQEPLSERILLGIACEGLKDVPFAPGSFSALHLAPLTHDEIWKALSDEFTDRPDGQPYFERLYAATRGHPLFFYDNLVQFTASGRTEIRVPDEALAAASARMNALPPVLRECLLQLSVLGESFYTNILDEFLHPHPPGHSLSLLSTEGFLRPSAYYPYEQYTFTSKLFWRSVYESIPPQFRQGLHRKAGELMEHAFSSRATMLASKIAEQFEGAEMYEKAFSYYLKAAEYCRAKSNFQGAFGHLDHARSLIEARRVAGAEALWQFHLESGLALLFKGHQNEAVEELSKALDYAKQVSNWVPACEIQTWVGKAYVQIGKWDQGEYYLQSAMASSNPEIVLDYYYESLYCLAYLQIYKGEVENARQRLAEILENVEEDDPLRAKAIAVQVLLDAEQWRAVPKSRYDPALEIFAKTGDRWNEAAILNNLGFYFERMNHFDEALYNYWHSYAYFYEIMNRPKFGLVTMNVGQIYLAMGELEDAEQHFDIAKGFAEMSGDYDGLSMVLHRRASTAYCDGRYEEAYRILEKSVQIGLEHGSPRWPVWSTIGLSECLLCMNRLDESREYAERALRLAEQKNDKKLRYYSLSRHGAADRLNGRPDRGTETLREVLAYADSVQDLDLRAYAAYYLNLQLHPSDDTSVEELKAISDMLIPMRDEEMQFRRALILVELYSRTGDPEFLQECDHILHVFPFHDARWRWCAAKARHALKLGDHDQAVHWIEKAYSGLNFVSSSIGNSEWREAFLEQPEAISMLNRYQELHNSA